MIHIKSGILDDVRAKSRKVKAKSRKGARPKAGKTVGNLDKPDRNRPANLNLKVPAEFKRELKQFALDHQKTITAVLVESFGQMKQRKKLSGIVPAQPTPTSHGV